MAYNESQITTWTDTSQALGSTLQSDLARIYGNFPYLALLSGRSGGQIIPGGTGSGDDLTLESTIHATKGSVIVKDQLSITGASRIRATRGTVQSISDSAWDKIEYNTEDYDNLSEYDNVTNFRFTVTQAGYYLILAQIGFVSTSWTAGELVILSIYKNGVIFTRGERSTTDATITKLESASVQNILSLAANDYIEIFVYQDSGAAINLDAANEKNYFCVHRLS